METDTLIEQAAALLGTRADARAKNRYSTAPQVETIKADGSSRRFFRLYYGAEGGDSLLAILPPEQMGQTAEVRAKEMAEAKSVALIGRHLYKIGAPTPEIYAWDEASGLVLCQDFGNRPLHGSALGPAEAGLRLQLYEKSLASLAHMQVHAAQGFDPSWCWDTPYFDSAFMQERESGYFLRALCRDMLGLHFDAAEPAEECRHLADSAAAAPGHYFLHRDFQSRNIMLHAAKQDAPAFIDFQGGRLGPLAYDVASLLLDPYAALPTSMQAHLLEVYLNALNRETSYDREQFRHEYLYLAVHRNMQMLGAFAFLSRVKAKPFFARFLRPAAASLAALLARAEFARYAGLRRLSLECCRKLENPMQ
ncbi:MAG: phosphotransferase [bacterium]|nr:phosphotransferase [bacterium]